MSIYLLTGAAGFIAYSIARQLLTEGHSVVGVDNINDAYDRRLKQWRLSQLQKLPNFHFHQADISNYAEIERIWQQTKPFDAVINLAARAGVRQSVTDPTIYFETNVIGTLNLLELCRKHKENKFILASSSSLYGQTNRMPFEESDNTDCPISPYAASKKGAEVLCYTYHSYYGIDTTIFRYFTVYGPAGRPDMSIFRFVQAINEGEPVTIFGDGSQMRDFTFVEDIARGTIAGLRPVGYEIINLGSDEPIKLLDVVSVIESKLGKRAKLEFEGMHSADVKATWANIEKARSILNWSPRTNYEQGIQRAIDWYLENRHWAKDIQTKLDFVQKLDKNGEAD
jgi:UDP-glucuronate 4-epimerase